jgi:hypothetical protein
MNRRWAATMAVAAFLISAWISDVLSQGIPITFELSAPSRVTIAIDDANGNRVRNICGGQLFPAGTQRVYWDGAEEFSDINYTNAARENYNVTRHRVQPGTYYVKGLIHDGIKMKYLASVYSPHTPTSPPWRVQTDGGYAGVGGWVGEHAYPVTGLKFKPAGSGFPYGPDQDIMIICGDVGEANDLVAWVAMDGSKLYGTHAENWRNKAGWSAEECVPRDQVTKDGRTYTIDHAAHTVKVSGGASLTIGKPGGPQVGPYDRERMHHPVSVDVDNEGRLWVAERDEAPRRVSLWNAQTGAFIKAFYGPVKYGGGGTVDPRDPAIFYYARMPYSDGNEFLSQSVAMEFKVDYQTGESEPVNILYRPALDSSKAFAAGHGPETALYFGDRRYMINTFNGFHRHCHNNAMIWRVVNGRAILCAGIGQVCEDGDASGKAHTRWSELARPDIVARYPSGAPYYNIMFAWSDLNLDEKVQAGEVAF